MNDSTGINEVGMEAHLHGALNRLQERLVAEMNRAKQADIRYTQCLIENQRQQALIDELEKRIAEMQQRLNSVGFAG